jgi:tripartite-type tricarboxylate transporter receptor subunit TctC
VKGYEMTFWFAAYTPAGTPPTIVDRLQALLVKATESAAAKNFYQTAGIERFVTKPEELAKFQVAESQKWGRIIKAVGIEPE